MLDYPRLEKLSTVADFFEPSIFGMPQLAAFTRTLFLVKLVTVAQNYRSSKCAGLSAPGKKAPCFRFSLTPHICDAPTCSFHQNLFLVELVIVAQIFRSSKCARLFAPGKSPHVSFFF